LVDYFTDKYVYINKKYDLNLYFDKLPLHFKLTKMDCINYVLAFTIAYYYGTTGHWLLNNFLGAVFSIVGI